MFSTLVVYVPACLVYINSLVHSKLALRGLYWDWQFRDLQRERERERERGQRVEREIISKTLHSEYISCLQIIKFCLISTLQYDCLVKIYQICYYIRNSTSYINMVVYLSLHWESRLFKRQWSRATCLYINLGNI